MKKFIKILLVTCILFTCFTVNVFADVVKTEINVTSHDVPNEDGIGTHTEIDSIAFAVEGEGNGYLISGGDYVLTENEANKFILVDGCDVKAANSYQAGDYRIINAGSYTSADGREKYMNFEEYAITSDNIAELASVVLTNIGYYFIYCPQNGDLISENIWADQFNVGENVTVNLSATINIFDSLYVYGNIVASGNSAISFYPPEDLPAHVEGNNIVLYDSDMITPITTISKHTVFKYIQEKWVSINEDEFVNELKTLKLALDKDATDDDLKDYIADKIYSTYIDQGSRHHLKTIFDNDSKDIFKTKINIITDSTETTNKPVKIDGVVQTDYFKYSLTGVDFIGIVYKINGKNKFILRDGDVYSTIDVGTSGQQVAELSYFDAVGDSKVVTKEVTYTVNIAEERPGGNYEIFGNYATFPANETGLMHDGQDTSHISIEIVRASKNAYSGLDCVLILYTEDFVGISVKSNEKAEPWNRENLPFYAINSNEEEASVFYMSGSIEISKPYGSPDNSNIVDINFENGTKAWNGCTISKNSNKFNLGFGSIFYDRIPILVKFKNGQERKVTIVRTGLMPGDYPAPGGSNIVNVFGTDVELEPDKRWLIATQFYYDTTSEPTERVKLFVKITHNDGSVEKKLISTTINSDVIDDDTSHNYKYFDVFELWRGDGNYRPQKIEMIVFDEGDSNNFGGVKLGSGSGSRWLRERGRQ